jgi:hypothetical protein
MDMVRHFEGGGALIEQWPTNKDTVLFLDQKNPGYFPGKIGHYQKK